MPLPPELSEAAVRSRLAIPAAQQDQIAPILRVSAESAPERSKFSLVDAVEYARRHSPRLQSARAIFEGAKGQEQVAFAAFLPEVGIASQAGANTRNVGPGIPSLTGFLLTSGVGPHQYAQGLGELQWTVYDFGRRTARYHQASARQRVAEFQLTRADQTVQFDAAVSYLDILLAQASLHVQDDAIRLAKAILKDARARLAGGVADPDDILRAEVQLSESQEGFVRAREVNLFAIAQLNNVMGRNAALPLEVFEVDLPSLESDLSLSKSLAIAAELRPEIQFAREAVVAAQEGVAAAEAAFRPNIFVRGSTGLVDGNNVLTGWQNGIGLHLVMPLYTGGRLTGDLHAAKAEVSAAVADAEVILNRVSLEVTQAFQAQVAAQQRLELSRTAVVEAQENLRLVRVKYQNGNATPSEIVDAETILTRSQQRQKTALYTYMATLTRLDYAVGQPQGTILRQARLSETMPAVLPTVR